MTIEQHSRNYINGAWVEATSNSWIDVVNPATEEPIASVKSSSDADVAAAVMAARNAFDSFSHTTVQERIEMLEKLLESFGRRKDQFAETLTREMGTPITTAKTVHNWLGDEHLSRTIEAMKRQKLEETVGTSRVIRQPAGVAALITPWNFPINQVFTKVASALGAGCTMVLKPSEFSPLDAVLFAEMVEEAGIPAGVFNLVFGEGPTVGRSLVRHPEVDVVSFTGSTRAGREISIDAANTIKVVHLELGGKSPNVILDDAPLETAVTMGIGVCYLNAGQACSVATRMLVPRAKVDQVAQIAKDASEAYVIGDPMDEATTLGPLINQKQWDHVQDLIKSGIDEGARVVTGGLGRPDGITNGYYVKPTVFADVEPWMRIAQEEIFGPVLSIQAYDTEAEAITLANNTIYGLAAVVQSADRERAYAVAKEIRAGHVYINHTNAEYCAVPFGGWKQSGNGYEHDEWGMGGFQLIKSVLGVDG